MSINVLGNTMIQLKNLVYNNAVVKISSNYTILEEKVRFDDFSFYNFRWQKVIGKKT